MEEFVSVEDVKRVFKAFCSKEISGCGSEEQVEAVVQGHTIRSRGSRKEKDQAT